MKILFHICFDNSEAKKFFSGYSSCLLNFMTIYIIFIIAMFITEIDTSHKKYLTAVVVDYVAVVGWDWCWTHSKLIHCLLLKPWLNVETPHPTSATAQLSLLFPYKYFRTILNIVINSPHNIMHSYVTIKL